MVLLFQYTRLKLQYAEAYWLEYTICAQRVMGSNPRKVNGGGKKGDLNSLLSSDKVSLLTRKQIP